MESENLWNSCLEIIKDSVNDKTYKTWFRPIVPIKYEGSDFTIQVPNRYFYEYIEEQYAHLIHATLSRVTGKNMVIYYRVFVDNSDQKKAHETISSDPEENNVHNTVKTTNGQELPQEWNSHLNSRLNFDNFFEGDCNILARRVGESISEQPGITTFNPLYIHGCTGVGKTHLCHAIGNKINALYPNKKVIYISSHLFQVQYTDAVRNNTINDFVKFYQSVDVLIIDDIQEFVGKERTQNAFFHIFNHLHLLKKQLILTSDKLPIEMQGLEERMITRMKWGMTAELQKPDLELRKQILRFKAQQDNLKLSEEIIDYIAENVTEHVRDLEGVVTSLVAHYRIFNKEIDLEFADQTVKKAVKMEDKIITPDVILNTVSNYFNIELKEIHSKSRKQEIVKSRQICMFLCKKHTSYSYAHIGHLIGKRDHATVLHACKTVQNFIDIDKAFRSLMCEIEHLLKK